MPPLPLPRVLPPVPDVSETLGAGDGPPSVPPVSVPPVVSHFQLQPLHVWLADGEGVVDGSLADGLGESLGVWLGVMLTVGVGDGAPGSSWTLPISVAFGKPRSLAPLSAACMYSVHT